MLLAVRANSREWYLRFAASREKSFDTLIWLSWRGRFSEWTIFASLFAGAPGKPYHEMVDLLHEMPDVLAELKPKGS